MIIWRYYDIMLLMKRHLYMFEHMTSTHDNIFLRDLSFKIDGTIQNLNFMSSKKIDTIF